MKIKLWEAGKLVKVRFLFCKVFLQIPSAQELFWITYNIIGFTKSPSVHMYNVCKSKVGWFGCKRKEDLLLI